MANEQNKDSPGTTLQPGQTIRPFVPTTVIKELVTNLYGLNVESFTELNSYDDKNFHVKVSQEAIDNDNIKELCPHGYVLKVLNSLDSEKPDFIDGQNEMMLFLHKEKFQCPVPVLSVDGKYTRREKIYKEGSDQWKENNLMERPYGYHLVRLLTFVHGKILYDVPYTSKLLYQMGQYIGRVDKTLQSFHHPAYEGHTTIWSLESIPKLSEFVYAIRNKENQKLITDIIEAFKDRVPKNYEKMKRGQLHGDFNEQNILVSRAAAGPGGEGDGYDISGMLDFGDTHISYYVFEVALTITYGMIECKEVDIFDVGGHVLAGYTSVMELSDLDTSLLKVCVAARYAQSLTMGEYTYSLDPGNDYLLTTAKRGWPQLYKLWSTPEEQLYQRWNEIRAQYHSI